MGSLKVTAELQSVLGKLNEKTELLDANGMMIGLFTPSSIAKADRYEEAKKRIDREEIKRRKATEKGIHTTKEILDRLQATESSE